MRRARAGIFLGYRYCASPAVNTANVQPRFPFGFGLSYATFAFGNLALNCTTAHPDDPIEVTLTVRNTGRVAGADVAQIYVSEQNPKVPRPRIELKAFQKVRLGSGESRTITLPLDRRSFAYWSEHDHAWTVAARWQKTFRGPGSFTPRPSKSGPDGNPATLSTEFNR